MPTNFIDRSAGINQAAKYFEQEGVFERPLSQVRTDLASLSESFEGKDKASFDQGILRIFNASKIAWLEQDDVQLKDEAVGKFREMLSPDTTLSKKEIRDQANDKEQEILAIERADPEYFLRKGEIDEQVRGMTTSIIRENLDDESNSFFDRFVEDGWDRVIQGTIRETIGRFDKEGDKIAAVERKILTDPDYDDTKWAKVFDAIGGTVPGVAVSAGAGLLVGGPAGAGVGAARGLAAGAARAGSVRAGQRIVGGLAGLASESARVHSDYYRTVLALTNDPERAADTAFNNFLPVAAIATGGDLVLGKLFSPLKGVTGKPHSMVLTSKLKKVKNVGEVIDVLRKNKRDWIGAIAEDAIVEPFQEIAEGYAQAMGYDLDLREDQIKLMNDSAFETVWISSVVGGIFGLGGESISPSTGGYKSEVNIIRQASDAGLTLDDVVTKEGELESLPVIAEKIDRNITLEAAVENNVDTVNPDGTERTLADIKADLVKVVPTTADKTPTELEEMATAGTAVGPVVPTESPEDIIARELEEEGEPVVTPETPDAPEASAPPEPAATAEAAPEAAEAIDPVKYKARQDVYALLPSDYNVNDLQALYKTVNEDSDTEVMSQSEIVEIAQAIDSVNTRIDGLVDAGKKINTEDLLGIHTAVNKDRPPSDPLVDLDQINRMVNNKGVARDTDPVTPEKPVEPGDVLANVTVPENMAEVGKVGDITIEYDPDTKQMFALDKNREVVGFADPNGVTAEDPDVKTKLEERAEIQFLPTEDTPIADDPDPSRVEVTWNPDETKEERVKRYDRLEKRINTEGVSNGLLTNTGHLFQFRGPHLEWIETNKIHPADVATGGQIIDGVYTENSGSVVPAWKRAALKEQQSPKIKLKDKEGSDRPPKKAVKKTATKKTATKKTAKKTGLTRTIVPAPRPAARDLPLAVQGVFNNANAEQKAAIDNSLDKDGKFEVKSPQDLFVIEPMLEEAIEDAKRANRFADANNIYTVLRSVNPNTTATPHNFTGSTGPIVQRFSEENFQTTLDRYDAVSELLSDEPMVESELVATLVEKKVFPDENSAMDWLETNGHRFSSGKTEANGPTYYQTDDDVESNRRELERERNIKTPKPKDKSPKTWDGARRSGYQIFTKKPPFSAHKNNTKVDGIKPHMRDTVVYWVSHEGTMDVVPIFASPKTTKPQIWDLYKNGDVELQTSKVQTTLRFDDKGNSVITYTNSAGRSYNFSQDHIGHEQSRGKAAYTPAGAGAWTAGYETNSLKFADNHRNPMVNAIVDQIKTVFGADVIFFQGDWKGERGKGLSGIYKEATGTIYINTRSHKNIVVTLGHELFHHFEKTNPKLLAEVASAMVENGVDMSAYNEHTRMLTEKYDYADDVVVSEFFAEVFGEMFRDISVLETVRLQINDQNLFQRLVTALKQAVAKLLGHAAKIDPEIQRSLLAGRTWNVGDIVNDYEMRLRDVHWALTQYQNGAVVPAQHPDQLLQDVDEELGINLSDKARFSIGDETVRSDEVLAEQKEYRFPPGQTGEHGTWKTQNPDYLDLNQIRYYHEGRRDSDMPDTIIPAEIHHIDKDRRDKAEEDGFKGPKKGQSWKFGAGKTDLGPDDIDTNRSEDNNLGPALYLTNDYDEASFISKIAARDEGNQQGRVYQILLRLGNSLKLEGKRLGATTISAADLPVWMKRDIVDNFMTDADKEAVTPEQMEAFMDGTLKGRIERSPFARHVPAVLKQDGFDSVTMIYPDGRQHAVVFEDWQVALIDQDAPSSDPLGIAYRQLASGELPDLSTEQQEEFNELYSVDDPGDMLNPAKDGPPLKGNVDMRQEEVEILKDKFDLTDEQLKELSPFIMHAEVAQSAARSALAANNIRNIENMTSAEMQDALRLIDSLGMPLLEEVAQEISAAVGTATGNVLIFANEVVTSLFTGPAIEQLFTLDPNGAVSVIAQAGYLNHNLPVKIKYGNLASQAGRLLSFRSHSMTGAGSWNAIFEEIGAARMTLLKQAIGEQRVAELMNADRHEELVEEVKQGFGEMLLEPETKTAVTKIKTVNKSLLGKIGNLFNKHRKKKGEKFSIDDDSVNPGDQFTHDLTELKILADEINQETDIEALIDKVEYLAERIADLDIKELQSDAVELNAAAIKAERAQKLTTNPADKYIRKLHMALNTGKPMRSTKGIDPAVKKGVDEIIRDFESGGIGGVKAIMLLEDLGVTELSKAQRLLGNAVEQFENADRITRKKADAMAKRRRARKGPRVGKEITDLLRDYSKGDIDIVELRKRYLKLKGATADGLTRFEKLADASKQKYDDNKVRGQTLHQFIMQRIKGDKFFNATGVAAKRKIFSDLVKEARLDPDLDKRIRLKFPGMTDYQIARLLAKDYDQAIKTVVDNHVQSLKSITETGVLTEQQLATAFRLKLLDNSFNLASKLMPGSEFSNETMIKMVDKMRRLAHLQNTGLGSSVEASLLTSQMSLMIVKESGMSPAFAEVARSTILAGMYSAVSTHALAAFSGPFAIAGSLTTELTKALSTSAKTLTIDPVLSWVRDTLAGFNFKNGWEVFQNVFTADMSEGEANILSESMPTKDRKNLLAFKVDVSRRDFIFHTQRFKKLWGEPRTAANVRDMFVSLLRMSVISGFASLNWKVLGAVDAASSSMHSDMLARYRTNEMLRAKGWTAEDAGFAKDLLDAKALAYGNELDNVYGDEINGPMKRQMVRSYLQHEIQQALVARITQEIPDLDATKDRVETLLIKKEKQQALKKKLRKTKDRAEKAKIQTQIDNVFTERNAAELKDLASKIESYNDARNILATSMDEARASLGVNEGPNGLFSLATSSFVTMTQKAARKHAATLKDPSASGARKFGASTALLGLSAYGTITGPLVTPARAADRFLYYMPVVGGFLSYIGGVQKGKGEFDSPMVRLLSDKFSERSRIHEQLIGSGIFLALFYMKKANDELPDDEKWYELTTGFPSDSTERKRWDDRKLQPYTMYVGKKGRKGEDKRLSLTFGKGVGAFFLYPAVLLDRLSAFKKDPTPDTMMREMGVNLMADIINTSSPGPENVTKFFDTFTSDDPRRVRTLIARTIGSMVPASGITRSAATIRHGKQQYNDGAEFQRHIPIANLVIKNDEVIPYINSNGIVDKDSEPVTTFLKNLGIPIGFLSNNVVKGTPEQKRGQEILARVGTAIQKRKNFQTMMRRFEDGGLMENEEEGLRQLLAQNGVSTVGEFYLTYEIGKHSELTFEALVENFAKKPDGWRKARNQKAMSLKELIEGAEKLRNKRFKQGVYTSTQDERDVTQKSLDIFMKEIESRISSKYEGRATSAVKKMTGEAELIKEFSERLKSKASAQVE